MNLPKPCFSEEKKYCLSSTCVGIEKWMSGVLLTAEMIGRESLKSETIEAVLNIYSHLQPEEFVNAVGHYYASGLKRYKNQWTYSDISTVIYAGCRLIDPARYLEIGVRRGRSMAIVAATRPDCHIVGFDSWKKNYGGIENPGKDFVEKEIKQIGHKGILDLVSGNSHEKVPKYLQDHPDAWFDLITVDGDHSPEGAARDIADVLPRLTIGGVLVFDDISHPAHPELMKVWEFYFSDKIRFSSWTFTDLGFGVAVAVRKA